MNNFEGTFNQWAINSSGLNRSAVAPPGSGGGQTSINGTVPLPQTVIQQGEAPCLSCAINKNAIEASRMLHHLKVSGTHHCKGNRVFFPFHCESLHQLHISLLGLFFFCLWVHLCYYIWETFSTRVEIFHVCNICHGLQGAAHTWSTFCMCSMKYWTHGRHGSSGRNGLLGNRILIKMGGLELNRR